MGEITISVFYNFIISVLPSWNVAGMSRLRQPRLSLPLMSLNLTRVIHGRTVKGKRNKRLHMREAAEGRVIPHSQNFNFHFKV